MRTLLDRLRGTSASERRYQVEGDIVFEFTPALSRECSEETLRNLREAIQQTDDVYPWRDKNDYDGTELPSIKYLGEPHYQYHNLSRPELHVWFSITPSLGHVRKSQIHCYEKYLEKLAEELAKQNLGVTSVRSVFRAGSVKYFGR